MNLRITKLLASAVCTLSVLGAAVAPTEAGVVPCLWNSLFGPCCGSGCGGGACYGPRGAYYGSSYGGCGPSGCGMSSYYAPACGSGCSPCGSGGCSPYSGACAPCGGYASCAPCASGDCALGSPAPSSIAPTPDQGWQRKKSTGTYADEQPGSGSSGSGAGAGSSTDATLGSPETLNRTTPESGLDSKKKSGGNPLTNEDETVRAQKPNADGETVPVNPKGSKKGPEAPPAGEKEAGSGQFKLPTIDLDEKVAWRPAPERKRVQLQSREANARLIRLPAYPQGEWTPVESESKVAKK